MGAFVGDGAIIGAGRNLLNSGGILAISSNSNVAPFGLQTINNRSCASAWANPHSLAREEDKTKRLLGPRAGDGHFVLLAGR